GQIAAIADTGLRSVARNLGKLQPGSEALLRRKFAIPGDHPEPRPPRIEFLRKPAALLVPLDHTRLRHSVLLCSRLAGTLLAAEWTVEPLQQRARLLIRGRGRAYDEVHAPDLLDLVEIDLRENDVLLQAERVIAAPVETLRIEPAEVAHARQRDVHDPAAE